MINAFMYHDIRNPKESFFPRRLTLRSFMSPLQFKRQLKFITENYRVIEPQRLKENLKEDCAILTFDDGLKDHYLVAELLHKAKLVPKKILGGIWGTTIFQDMPRSEKGNDSKKPHECGT